MANIAVKHSESERRKKALLYTAVICGILLLMFFLISWKTMPPAPPPPEQLIEVNLGNMEEGEGDIQPLIKGERGPSEPTYEQPQPAATSPDNNDDGTPDDNADETSAPVNKTVKKVNTPTTVNK